MFDTIFQTAVTDYSLSISSTLISVMAALLFGLVISIVYFITTPKKERSSSFTLSLIILPTIVAVVIMLIGGNLARAFSMAGVFTLVRFRSVPGDSKDISIVFLSMAVGLAAGLGYLTLGAVVTVVIGLAIIIVTKSGYGVTKQKEKQLKITIPEDMNYQGAFDEVFLKYTSFYELKKVKTTNLGTLFELTYEILIKDSSAEKEFIDALRCRNGNLNIMLGMKESNSQQL
jgi:hypothetical protein